MPKKRSQRNSHQKFYCPCCYNPLWQVGSPKYYIFHQEKLAIQKGFKLTSKKDIKLASQPSSFVNNNIWIEEFFCEKDGKIWMYIEKSSNGQIISRPALREDWQGTPKTPDPKFPHKTVSEFTHLISRPASTHLIKKYNYEQL